MDERKLDSILTHVKLVVLGGITLYEDEGMDIMRMLDEQKNGRLAYGLSMLGASLHWALELIDDIARQLKPGA